LTLALLENQLRIAFYAPLKPPDHPVASGDRNMAQALIAAWRLAGHDVLVASRFRSFDAGVPLRQARLQALGSRLAGRLVGRLGGEARRPDLWFTYHLYHKAPDWLGPPVAARLGIPYFVCEASYAPKQAGGRWDLGHRSVGDAIRAADRIFQPNPADAECVAPLVASADRLVALPPFLDTAPFRTGRAASARAVLARQFGLDARTPWLLTVAMMRDDQKLASYLSLAAALAQLNQLPWSLILVGAGPAERRIRQAFAAFGDRVRWTGMLDRSALPELYGAADLYVWPAIKEAWGMAVLEAQAAGLPVVAGRSGGIAGIVKEGETGLLPPEGDVSAFAAALRTLLTNPELRQCMSLAAQRRTKERHDISAAAALLDRHLAAVLAGRS
jgi:glycosyltransferase involved in cell wall biosynthesis